MKIQGVTRGYRRSYKGLQGVTRGYRGLQGITGGLQGVHKGLQWVTGASGGYKELQGVTVGLQGVTRGYRGLQQKYLEFIFSIKAFPFNSKASIRAHKHIF